MLKEPWVEAGVALYLGDCLEVLPGLEANRFHAIVTDPPYGLEFMGQEWDAPWKYGMQAFGFKDGKSRNPGPSFTSTRNPMCKVCHKHKRGSKSHTPCTCEMPQFDELDHRLADMAKFQAWCTTWATECLRVAKPGAYMLVFGGTRTWHRLVCAIEDAGWEIRDTLMWVYSSGFPKSLSVDKAIDKAAGAERKVVGKYHPPEQPEWNLKQAKDPDAEAAPGSFTASGRRTLDVTAPATDAAKQWEGWGTALKPAWEPILLCRKPLDGTVAANTLKQRCGGLNIDACRVGYESEADKASATPQGRCTSKDSGAIGAEPDAGRDMERVEFQRPPLRGRWPANLILDGSEAVLSCFPQSKGQQGGVKGTEPSHTGDENGATYGEYGRIPSLKRGDAGSAARFFKSCPYGPEDEEALRLIYCSKASRSERRKGLPQDVRADHPTVKPQALLRYLCRLICPPDGEILDPFVGSGSTIVAAIADGFRACGIDSDRHYLLDLAIPRAKHALK